MSFPGHIPDITGHIPDITGRIPDITGYIPDITGCIQDIIGPIPDIIFITKWMSGIRPVFWPYSGHRCRVAEMNFAMPTNLVGMTNSYLPNHDLCLPNRKVQITGPDTAIPTERHRMY